MILTWLLLSTVGWCMSLSVVLWYILGFVQLRDLLMCNHNTLKYFLSQPLIKMTAMKGEHPHGVVQTILTSSSSVPSMTSIPPRVDNGRHPNIVDSNGTRCMTTPTPMSTTATGTISDNNMATTNGHQHPQLHMTAKTISLPGSSISMPWTSEFFYFFYFQWLSLSVLWPQHINDNFPSK